MQPIIPIALSLVLVAATPAAGAVTHQFTFSGSLTAVNPSTNGFPLALQDLAIGTPFSGALTFEHAPAPVDNPFPAPFDLATMYALPAYTMNVNVGGHLLASWPAAAAAFVWNDVSVSGPGDGLLFANLALPGRAQFQLGNLLYPQGQFSSAALPMQSVPGGFVLQVGLAGPGDPWFSGTGHGLEFSAAVPEPSMAALWLAGLAAGAGWRLRRR